MTEREKLVELMARAIEPHMPAQVKYWQEGGMMRAKLIGPYDPEYVSPVPAALAALTALEAAGVRLVPSEATEDQFRAGSAFRMAVERHGYRDTEGLYRTMLAASPYAPEAEG